uniref:Uncharacterized protein n=1 Tax=Anguilla anguilla TaxID=7936 RepID=A0A0E9VR01_ANGAN
MECMIRYFLYLCGVEAISI